MPIYNSEENKILSSLEDAYKGMIDEGLEKFKKAQAERRRNRMDPDEEKVEVKSEKPPVYDAEAGPTKKLKTRKMRKGEGLGVGARKRQGAGKPMSAAPRHGGGVQFQ